MASYSIVRLLSLSVISRAIAQHISLADNNERTTCTVLPGKDNTTDDVPTILKAFDKCGHGGNIIFPRNETYHINSRLNPHVNDVNIDWQGQWVVSSLYNLHPLLEPQHQQPLTLPQPQSSPKTSSTGETTHTTSNSKTMRPASS